MPFLAGNRPDLRYPFSEGANRAQRRVAVTVAGSFAAAGILWVFTTDYLLYALVRDPAVAARIETAKGCLFVVLAALLIYLVTWRSTRRLVRGRAAISAVVDSIADGVLLLGSERTIIGANPAALRLLGVPAVDTLIGMDPETFIRRFQLTRLDGAAAQPGDLISQRVFEHGGRLRNRVTIRPESAPPLVVSVSATAVRSDLAGTGDLVVSVMHDVTESERFEHMRDQFFRAAAHSLKTPLTIIKGHVRMLAHGNAPRPGHSAEVIDRQCGRIDRLMQNLLVLSRLRSNTLQLYRNEVDLAELTDRIVREMSVACPDHALHLDNVPSLAVDIDQERLAMVLRDLLEEAATCAVADAAITVSVARHDNEAEVVVAYPARDPGAWLVDGHPEYDVLGVAREVGEAIATAHGGRLEWEETAGHARSRLRLPLSG